MAEPLALCDKGDTQQQELWLPSGCQTQLGVWLCLTHPNTALILLLCCIVKTIYPSYQGLFWRSCRNVERKKNGITSTFKGFVLDHYNLKRKKFKNSKWMTKVEVK